MTQSEVQYYQSLVPPRKLIFYLSSNFQESSSLRRIIHQRVLPFLRERYSEPNHQHLVSILCMDAWEGLSEEENLLAFDWQDDFRQCLREERGSEEGEGIRGGSAMLFLSLQGNTDYGSRCLPRYLDQAIFEKRLTQRFVTKDTTNILLAKDWYALDQYYLSPSQINTNTSIVMGRYVFNTSRRINRKDFHEYIVPTLRDQILPELPVTVYESTQERLIDTRVGQSMSEWAVRTALECLGEKKCYWVFPNSKHGVKLSNESSTTNSRQKSLSPPRTRKSRFDSFSTAGGAPPVFSPQVKLTDLLEEMRQRFSRDHYYEMPTTSSPSIVNGELTPTSSAPLIAINAPNEFEFYLRDLLTKYIDDEVIRRQLRWERDRLAVFGVAFYGYLDDLLLHQTLAYRKSARYIDRQSLLADLIQQLAPAATTAGSAGSINAYSYNMSVTSETIGSGRRIICFVGRRGSGKTTLLSRVAMTMATSPVFQEQAMQQMTSAASLSPASTSESDRSSVRKSKRIDSLNLTSAPLTVLTKRIPVIIRYCGTTPTTSHPIALLHSLNIHLLHYYMQREKLTSYYQKYATHHLYTSTENNIGDNRGRVRHLSLSPNIYDDVIKYFHYLLKIYPTYLFVLNIHQLNTSALPNEALNQPHAFLLGGVGGASLQLHPLSRMILSCAPPTTPLNTSSASTTTTVAPLPPQRVSRIHLTADRDSLVVTSDDSPRPATSSAHYLKLPSNVLKIDMKEINQKYVIDAAFITSFLGDKGVRLNSEGSGEVAVRWLGEVVRRFYQSSFFYLTTYSPLFSVLPPQKNFNYLFTSDITTADVINYLLHYFEEVYGRLTIAYTFSILSLCRGGVSDDDMIALLSSTPDVVEEIHDMFHIQHPDVSNTITRARFPAHLWFKLKANLTSHLLEEEYGDVIHPDHMPMPRLRWVYHEATSSNYWIAAIVERYHVIRPALHHLLGRHYTAHLHAPAQTQTHAPIWLPTTKPLYRDYEVVEGLTHLLSAEAVEEVVALCCRFDVIATAFLVQKEVQLIDVILQTIDYLEHRGSDSEGVHRLCDVAYWLTNHKEVIATHPRTLLIATATRQPTSSEVFKEVQRYLHTHMAVSSDSTSSLTTGSAKRSKRWCRTSHWFPANNGSDVILPFLRHLSFQYPQHYLNTSLRTYRSLHNEVVSSVTWNPMYSQIVATSSFDKTIKVWNLHTGHLLYHYRGEHSEWITVVTWNHSGALLASGSSDATVKIWEVHSGRKQCTLQHGATVTALTWHPYHSDILATGSDDCSVKIWNLALPTPLLCSIDGVLLGGVTDVCWLVDYSHHHSDDDEEEVCEEVFLAAASKDGQLRSWAMSLTRSRYELLYEPRHSHSVQDEEEVERGGGGGGGGGDFITCLTQDPRTSFSAPHSATSSLLLGYGMRRGRVAVWDMRRHCLLLSWQAHSADVSAIAWFLPTTSSVNPLLLTASHDGSVKCWEALTSRLITTVAQHSSSVVSMSLRGDHHRLVISCEDRSLHLLDTSSLHLPALTSSTTPPLSIDQPIVSLTWRQQAREMIAVTSTSEVFRLDCADGHVIQRLLLPPSDEVVQGGGVGGVVDVNPLSGVYVYVSRGDKLYWSNLLTSETKHNTASNTSSFRPLPLPITTGSDVITAIKSSGEGSILIVGFSSGRVVFCDLFLSSSSSEAVKAVRMTSDKHSSRITSADWSPDETKCVIASADTTVTVWDVSAGSVLLTLDTSHEHDVSAVSWSSQNIIASGDVTGIICCWDGGRGDLLHQFSCHGGCDVRALSWHPSGQWLASVSNEEGGCLKVWGKGSLEIRFSQRLLLGSDSGSNVSRRKKSVKDVGSINGSGKESTGNTIGGLSVCWNSAGDTIVCLDDRNRISLFEALSNLL